MRKAGREEGRERGRRGMAAEGRSAYCAHVVFFQAEDGIRDLTVTGVQTCALPISSRHGSCRKPTRTLPMRLTNSCPRYREAFCVWRCGRGERTWRSWSPTYHRARSEERRVGEERRSRWSPYH